MKTRTRLLPVFTLGLLLVASSQISGSLNLTTAGAGRLNRAASEASVAKRPLFSFRSFEGGVSVADFKKSQLNKATFMISTPEGAHQVFYRLEFRKGSKWIFVTKGPLRLYRGRYHMKKLFAGKSPRIGRYRLKLSTFAVTKWPYRGKGTLKKGTLFFRVLRTTRGMTGAVQLSNGGHSTCAVLQSGTIKCWGINNFGQLGDGTTSERGIPVSVKGITTAVQVSVGSQHACALLKDGTIMCWGSNYYGQLGDGVTNHGYRKRYYGDRDRSQVPVLVKGITTAIQVSVGGTFTCALLEDHTARCWGYNDDDQLGATSGTETIDMGTTYLSRTPLQVQGIAGASAISSSEYHSCALLEDATIKCWGVRSDGELGDGTVTGVIQVNSGWNHTCALLADHTVKCWGAIRFRDIGHYRPTPVPVPGITNAVQVSFPCAVLQGGTVKCWGEISPAGVTSAVQVAAGSGSSCVLLKDTTVRCWGGYRSNAYGQLGDGSRIDSSTPVVVGSGVPVA